jgi:hypothetical protein
VYGLPTGFDATIFVGRRLDRICFAQYIIFFYFDDDLVVNLEASFTVEHASGKQSRKQAAPVDSSDVMALIGQTVKWAASEPEGTLAIGFEGGETLRFLDDKSHYESYSIDTPEGRIIV